MNKNKLSRYDASMQGIPNVSVDGAIMMQIVKYALANLKLKNSQTVFFRLHFIYFFICFFSFFKQKLLFSKIPFFFSVF